MKFSFYLAALFAALMACSCQAQETALVNAPELPVADLHAAATAPSEPGSGSMIAAPFVVSSMPAAPAKAGRLTWTDWGLISIASTLRVLDYTSTETCLSHPKIFQEQLLPNALVNNKPGFAAFEGSTMVANYFAYRALARRHRAAVRAGQAIYDGLMGTAVSVNYYGIEKYLH